MVNKEILCNRLNDHFRSMAFHAIVNEAFINALPLDKSEIDRKEIIGLTRYSNKVMDKIGGFHALEAAVVQNPDNILLSDMYCVCVDIAKEATNRVLAETDCKSETIDEVMNKASFTDEEFEKFAKDAASIDTETISDIIKEKTLSVIKSEQDQYQKDEELSNTLKNVIAPMTEDPAETEDADSVTADTSGEAENVMNAQDAEIEEENNNEGQDTEDTSVESFIDRYIGKDVPKHHVSVFSRLQESAMEMMLITPIEDMDPMPLVERVTFESFLNGLRDLDVCNAMESCHKITNEELCTVPRETRPQMATLVSIIVYTVMETLKTMKLYNPSMSDVTQFVNTQTISDNVQKMNVDHVIAKANEAIMQENMIDHSKVSTSTLNANLDELSKVKDLLENILANDNMNKDATYIMNLKEKVTNVIDRINGVLNDRNIALKDSQAIESALQSNQYTLMRRKADVAQYNKIHKLYSKNPNISEIRLNLTPGFESVINVDALDASGQVLRQSFMNMENAVESSRFVGYMKELYQESDMTNTEKRVSILIKDGTGKKINLN